MSYSDCDIDFNTDDLIADSSDLFSTGSSSRDSTQLMTPAYVEMPDYPMLGEPKRAGRKETEGTILLMGISSKSGKPLKKEYKRCQIIRLIKKLLRQFKAHEFTKKISTMFDPTNANDASLLGEMKELYINNKELFDFISETTSGPLTECRDHCIRKGLASAQRSFNNAFCTAFYSHSAVREFHHLVVKLIYGSGRDVSPSNLCRKLNERCCESGKHKASCTTAWTNVRRYMQVVMLEELGYEPFETEVAPFTLESDPNIELFLDF